MKDMWEQGETRIADVPPKQKNKKETLIRHKWK